MIFRSLLFVSVFSSVVLGGPTVEVESILTEETNAASPDNLSAEVFANPATKLNVDFSSLGDVTFCYRLTAPAGHVFHVDFPQTGFFSISYDFGSVSVATLRPTLNVNFIDYVGAPLGTPPFIADAEFTTSTNVGGNLARMSVGYIVLPSEFSFSSVALCTEIPASYDIDFSTIAGDVIAEVSGQISQPEGSYGQFVSLRAIPEPSAFAFLGLIGLVAGGRSWLKRRS